MLLPRAHVHGPLSRCAQVTAFPTGLSARLRGEPSWRTLGHRSRRQEQPSGPLLPGPCPGQAGGDSCACDPHPCVLSKDPPERRGRWRGARDSGLGSVSLSVTWILSFLVPRLLRETGMCGNCSVRWESGATLESLTCLPCAGDSRKRLCGFKAPGNSPWNTRSVPTSLLAHASVSSQALTLVPAGD